MSKIHTFTFDTLGIEQIRKSSYGRDWPIVYMIENGNEIYIGETISAYSRTKQHFDDFRRKNLKSIHVFYDDEFNKSAALDTESSLIQYLVADGHYKLQNSNSGLQNHSYFDREKYISKFELLWLELQNKKIAFNDLVQIRNSDLFKFSPYKTLTDEQLLIADKLITEISNFEPRTYIINGGPGTGKTILAIYLIKQIVESGNKNVALVIAMTSLRETIQKVFSKIKGLSSSMVIGPGDVVGNIYDVLVVDEAHRLRQRRNIVNYKSFDNANKYFNLDHNGTEIDWIVASTKKAILFYDKRQTVRPSDINEAKIKSYNPISFYLKNQLRNKGGENYVEYIESIFNLNSTFDKSFSDYDFKVIDNIEDLISLIKSKEVKHGLSRLIAGYAWPWDSRTNKNKADIILGDVKLFWNSVTKDWVNSPNAINEVGCIHTIQGYELNYAGVIIGPEISYNKTSNKIEIDREKYYDTNGKRAVWNDEELLQYIKNIYKTLLTRAIQGTYVYICNPDLRDYIKSRLK